jgi:hypothetical protein
MRYEQPAILFILSLWKMLPRWHPSNHMNGKGLEVMMMIGIKNEVTIMMMVMVMKKWK